MQQPDEDKIELAEGEDVDDDDEGGEQGEDASEAGDDDASVPPMTAEEAQAKYKLGREASREERYEDALSLLEPLVKPFIKLYGDTSAELGDLYYRLGRIYLNAGKKASDSLYSSMVKKQLNGPQNPSFHFEGDDSSEEGGGNADELLDSAWKALEYARVIYEERKSQPIELSDVHLALGEFCQEMEQPQSETIGEYTKALVLRQSLPDDTPATTSATSKDRLLAEAYYELALTHLSFGLQVEAIDHFNRAANLLRKRMEALAKDAAEVEELKGIIADVDDKVTELKALAKAPQAQEAALAKQAAAAIAPASAPAAPATPKAAGPVNVLNHLVRKRPTTDTATSPTPPAKLPAVASPAPAAASPAAAPAASPAAPQGNGHASAESPSLR